MWDVGAHRGYATLIAAREVSAPESVVAVEPSSLNRWYLTRHLRWNGLDRVRILPCALWGEDGRSTIGGSGGSVAFVLGEGREEVPVRSGASLVERDGIPPPTFLKVDVEGAEADVLRGAENLLGSHLVAVVSVHSRRALDGVREVLTRRGFRIHESSRLRELRALEEGKWPDDPDLVAVGRRRSTPPDTLERFGFREV